MRLSLLALPTFLAGAVAGGQKEARSRRHLNKEFMNAMHSNPRVSGAEKKHRAQKIRKLHENLIHASRKLNSNNQYQQSKYQQYSQQAAQDYSNYQYGEAYSNVATWNGTNWNFDGAVPFDMTSRAFKYSGCAAIKTYDEERAYETGNPMILDTYAVFRLCPADKCNKYSMTGCGKNYGEYAVEMKTYLSYVLNYYTDRFTDYCDYCEPCDWEYQAGSKSDLQQCYAQLAQQKYYQAQQSQQQAWQAYYNANNGDMSGWNVNNQGNGNGDQNFQNYNSYYNAAHNYNAYYNNQRNGNGTSYSGNGNRNLGSGYFDENGNWVDGSNGDDGGANGNANNAANNGMYQDEYGNYVYGQQNQGNANGNYNYANAANNANGGGQNGYWGADGNWYQNSMDDQFGGYQQCQDGSMCDACQAANQKNYQTCDDYTCKDYYTFCSELFGEQNKYYYFDPLDYLECQEYQNDYGKVYYIGPHCGSDHFTISLGVFSDENCLNYIGQDISVSTVLGFHYNDDDLFKLPKECISCDGAVSPGSTTGDLSGLRLRSHIFFHCSTGGLPR